MLLNGVQRRETDWCDVLGETVVFCKFTEPRSVLLALETCKDIERDIHQGTWGRRRLERRRGAQPVCDKMQKVLHTKSDDGLRKKYPGDDKQHHVGHGEDVEGPCARIILELACTSVELEARYTLRDLSSLVKILRPHARLGHRSESQIQGLNQHTKVSEKHSIFYLPEEDCSGDDKDRGSEARKAAHPFHAVEFFQFKRPP